MPPSPTPDIEAEIRFLKTEEDGKKTAYRSGLRTVHDFGRLNSLVDALHTYPDVDEVHPGQSARALMSFLNPQHEAGRLFEGFEFTMQVGTRIIGHGRVTKILNEDLRRR